MKKNTRSTTRCNVIPLAILRLCTREPRSWRAIKLTIRFCRVADLSFRHRENSTLESMTLVGNAGFSPSPHTGVVLADKFSPLTRDFRTHTPLTFSNTSVPRNFCERGGTTVGETLRRGFRKHTGLRKAQSAEFLGNCFIKLDWKFN